MEQKYNTYILEAINNSCDQKIRAITYQIQSVKKHQQKQGDGEGVFKEIEDIPLKHIESASSRVGECNLNSRYTFGSFIPGEGNQLAYSASLAVTEQLGTRYNPLFLYGDVGLGKTHLMQAIGHKVQKTYSGIKVLYTTFEKFTNDYVAAARRGTFDEFRKAYREVDILLVDDVQFMIDKEKTQEEFFHTFEVLHDNNKQIVITSDRPPKALVELQDRMISRFEWGMIADIKMPDLETRIAILENKCKERNFELSQEIIKYIVENIKNNVRELEGALNKIIAMYELNRKPATISSVREILSNLMIDPSKNALTARRVLETVAEFYELNMDDIMGASRKQVLVLPRQIAMYLMRRELEYSFPTIGNSLGGRDHTTVMYACQKVEDLLSQERLKQEVETIRQRLYG
jgi:chromosomal replication initiator protein